MEIHVTSWREIQTTYVYDVIYLYGYPAHDSNISDNDHLKLYKKNCAEKYKSKILTKS